MKALRTIGITILLALTYTILAILPNGTAHAAGYAGQPGSLCYSRVASSSSDQVSTKLANGLIDMQNYGTFYIGQQFDQHLFNLAYCDGSGQPTSYTYSLVTQDPTMEKYITVGGCTSITIGISNDGTQAPTTCTLPAGGQFIIQTNTYAMHADHVVPQRIPYNVTLQSPAGTAQVTYGTIYYYCVWSGVC